MLETPDKLELLAGIDILVDGRHDKSKRNLMLQFRGSSTSGLLMFKNPSKKEKSSSGTSSMMAKKVLSRSNEMICYRAFVGVGQERILFKNRSAFRVFSSSLKDF